MSHGSQGRKGTGLPSENPMAEAHGLINGDRKTGYGEVKLAFQDVADIWTALLRSAGLLARDKALGPRHVALMMTGLKLQREANRPKRDNVVDGHGYLGLLGQIEGY